MLTSLRKKLAIAAMGLLLGVAPAAALPVAAYAADSAIGTCVSQGVNLDVSNIGDTCGGTTDTSAGNDKIKTIITTIINFFSVIVGVIAVIMIIYAGFKYITSGGDSGNVTSARQTIVYAVVGLVIVALSQFIVKFVLGKVTG